MWLFSNLLGWRAMTLYTSSGRTETRERALGLDEMQYSFYLAKQLNNPTNQFHFINKRF